MFASQSALKNYTKDLHPGFPHFVRTCIQIFKNHEGKAKRPLLAFVSISLIYPILDGIFSSQRAPKVPVDPNKDIIFIKE